MSTTRTARLGARLLVAALASAAVVGATIGAAPAVAGQIVYPAGTGIWAMNEDGSGQHELVSATQVPEMMALFDPDVQPNGNEVVFDGEWNQAPAEEQQALSSPGACGGECLGYYELSGGAVKRISPPPFHCPQAGCASEEIDPRVADDGSVAFVSESYVTVTGFCEFTCGTELRKGQSALLSRDASGGNEQQWKTPCESEATEGHWVTDADVLSVDPGNANQLAYGNCQELEQGAFFTYPTAFDVLLSGANRANGSEYSIAASNPVYEPNEFSSGAGYEIQDVSYSADGKQLVDARSGQLGVAGIYTYPAANNGSVPGTEVLAVPENWIFYSVRFVGGGRIAFAAGVDANKDGTIEKADVYSIPASCTPQTCSFPGSATNLTNTGNVNPDYLLGTANIGYTSSTATLEALGGGGPKGSPPPEKGSGKEGSTKGKGSKEQGSKEGQKPVLSALRVSPKAFALKRHRHKKAGATISYKDSQAATTTLAIELQRHGVRHGKRCATASAKHRSSHGKRCVSVSVVGRITHADSAGKNKISFSGKVGGHTLRPGRYVLVATAVDSAGKSKAVKTAFTVKR